MNKSLARRKYGKEKVHLWRRSYDIRPPEGESLKDVYARVVPYFKEKILPLLPKNNIIISAHGNSLRGLIKHLDDISNEYIPQLELPYAQPIVYTYKRGELIRETHEHSFNRPMHWTRPKEQKHRKKR